MYLCKINHQMMNKICLHKTTIVSYVTHNTFLYYDLNKMQVNYMELLAHVNYIFYVEIFYLLRVSHFCLKILREEEVSVF